MIAAVLASVCWSADPAPVDPAVQAVHEAEWARAPAADFAPWTRDPEPEVRRAAAIGLGRLRSADAIPLLQDLLIDPDPAVHLAAVEALGYTPGAAPILRERLARAAPVGDGWADSAREEKNGDLPRLLDGVGRVGDASDVALLTHWVAAPWPVGAAAADALGRMGRRGITQARGSVPDLVRCLGRPDPRTVDACAWAISRIGVADAGLATDAVERLSRLPTEQSRAWVIKGAWPGLTAEARTDLFVHAISGASRLVQVAALDAVESGQVPADIVAPWLVHPDGWVRASAAGALGRLDTPEADEALHRYAEQADQWAAATALEAAGTADPAAARDTSLPSPMRAALAGALTSLGDLTDLALHDGDPIVRSAAAGAISEREDVDWQTGAALLGSDDAAVREVAVDLTKSREPAVAGALLGAAAVETDPEVMRAELDQLAQQVAGDPKKWPPARVSPALAHAGAFSSGRVAAAAKRLASAVGATPPSPAPAPAERDLTLPSSAKTKVPGEFPSLDEVERIRTAVVETNRGEFVLSLDPETAPLAVWNFAVLADAGYYDDRPIHRLVPGFVMQTGCPRGDGWGGPGWTLPDEPSQIPYRAGSLGMARSDYDTGGSQWFVTLADTPHLTGEYTRFGEVAHGMAVLGQLERGDRILSVRIERVGEVAAVPEVKQSPLIQKLSPPAR